MCPICLTGEDAALLEGLRAGVVVLMAVAVCVAAPLVRFGLRLWREEARQGHPE